MKKSIITLVALVFVMALALAVVIPATTAAPDNQVRVWVEFRPGQGALVERLLQRAGAEFHYTFDELNSYVVTLPQAALDGVRRSADVVDIQEDAKRYMDADTIPYGIDLVQARDIWDTNRDGQIDAGAPNGAGRTVCIIDSGLYAGHEDFQGVNIKGGYPSDWNVDRCGHGTHVAGTIAAAVNDLGVVGVNPGTVSLYIVKVFGDGCGWTYSSTLADAANRCKSAGANVISMSLGGGVPNPNERKTFDSLNNNGILSIAAAGNTGVNEMHYPASYSSVVGVGAIDANKQIADFSTFNSDVELSAPGVHVLSTVPYRSLDKVTVNGVDYAASNIEFAPLGDASGALADGGRCAATNTAWSGKVVLCERGDIAFYDKVHNVQLSGGKAAIIYNNVSGAFEGTLGEGNTATIQAVTMSREDGLVLMTMLGATAAVHTQPYIWDQNEYAYYDGTSMATPHVSAVAALVWSWKPSLTNTQIRNALNNTAEDLGSAGRDIYYGYGLVQAYDAWVSLGGGGTPSDAPPTVSVTSPAEGATVSGSVTISATAGDDKGVTQVEFFVDNTSLGVDTSSPYQATWNTASAANGAHTVKAVASDTIGQTATDTNAVTVSNTTPGSTLHVGDLDGSVSGARRWSASVTIYVHDANHAPVAGVSVSGAWSAGASGNASCTTDSAGKCSVSKSNLAASVSSVTFSVNNLTKSGYTYTAGNNHDPEADSNGTSIVVRK